MSEERLRILVVEDREENREAAREYFNTREDISVDYTGNFRDAVQELEAGWYAGAILDLEFPRTEEDEPEKLGLELGRELDVVESRYRVPHIFLTGGYFHHERPVAKVFIDEHDIERERGKETLEKTNPQAWQDAYEKLTEICPNMDKIAAQKRRAWKFSGKIHREQEDNQGDKNE